VHLTARKQPHEVGHLGLQEKGIPGVAFAMRINKFDLLERLLLRWDLLVARICRRHDELLARYVK